MGLIQATGSAGGHDFAVYADVYFVSISLLAAGLTIYDKCAARKGSWRVKEAYRLVPSAFHKKKG
jgi:uncharacterized membrane protein YsdA (DUF1294 family)